MSEFVRIDSVVLMYAFRYALGRQSYAVADVAKMLIEQRAQLRNDWRQKIVDEIDLAISEDRAGAESDVAIWRSVAVMMSLSSELEEASGWLTLAEDMLERHGDKLTPLRIQTILKDVKKARAAIAAYERERPQSGYRDLVHSIMAIPTPAGNEYAEAVWEAINSADLTSRSSTSEQKSDES
jgi:hypothetical protein